MRRVFPRDVHAYKADRGQCPPDTWRTFLVRERGETLAQVAAYPDPAQADLWVTVEEAAVLVGCSTKTVRRMIVSGRVEAKGEGPVRGWKRKWLVPGRSGVLVPQVTRWLVSRRNLWTLQVERWHQEADRKGLDPDLLLSFLLGRVGVRPRWLARALGVSKRTLRRWRQGQAVPLKYARILRRIARTWTL